MITEYDETMYLELVLRWAHSCCAVNNWDQGRNWRAGRLISKALWLVLNKALVSRVQYTAWIHTYIHTYWLHALGLLRFSKTGSLWIFVDLCGYWGCWYRLSRGFALVLFGKAAAGPRFLFYYSVYKAQTKLNSRLWLVYRDRKLRGFFKIYYCELKMLPHCCFYTITLHEYDSNFNTLTAILKIWNSNLESLMKCK